LQRQKHSRNPRQNYPSDLSDNELTSSENFEVSKVTRLRCRVLRASICLQFLQALDTDKGKGKENLRSRSVGLHRLCKWQKFSKRDERIDDKYQKLKMYCHQNDSYKR
jgi:hypothetical protein